MGNGSMVIVMSLWDYSIIFNSVGVRYLVALSTCTDNI
jgi:hypothetical protein